MLKPPGFKAADKSLVCKLNKALYGLKQAPWAWFEKLSTTLFQFGFKSCRCDSSLFLLKTTTFTIYILVYVDDILITGSSPTHITQLVKAQFCLFFKIPWYSRFISRNWSQTYKDGSIPLNQPKYIRHLLEKAKMTNAKGISTPMATGCKFSRTGSADDPSLYRSIVGALQYATITRPEISYSVNKEKNPQISPRNCFLWTAPQTSYLSFWINSQRFYRCWLGHWSRWWTIHLWCLHLFWPKSCLLVVKKTNLGGKIYCRIWV